MNSPVVPSSASITPTISALSRLDRVIGELRRSDIIRVRTQNQTLLVSAAENLARPTLAALHSLSEHAPLLMITGQRARRLGLNVEPRHTVYCLRTGTPLTIKTIAQIVNPVSTQSDPGEALSQLEVSRCTASDEAAQAIIAMIKHAGLLPAAVVVTPHPDHKDPDMLEITVDEIRTGLAQVNDGLLIVAQADVPLQDCEDTQIIAFRPRDGSAEHLAIIVGQPDMQQPVLIRIHSECYTGDLLGSLRCDCGHQLRGAISLMADSGGGVLLYLAQEGRGIGLINKLRAYRLQDLGRDTVDANLDLGFEEDERDYQIAAQILETLKIKRVRLLTNNPKKVAALSALGVEVVERVEHVFAANRHNRHYLYTKGARSGHLFDLGQFAAPDSDKGDPD